MEAYQINHDYFYEVIQSWSQDKDIPYLAGLLAEKIASPVIVTNGVSRVLVFHDPSGTGLRVGEFFFLAAGKLPVKEDCCNENFSEGIWNADGQDIPYIYLPLRASGYLLGYCIVLAANQVGFTEKNKVWQTSLVLSLALKNKFQYETEQEQFQDEFIRDILYNNYDSKVSIYQKARLWHWNFDGPLIVVVMETQKDKLSLTRQLSPRFFNRQAPVYAVINAQLVIILSLRGQEWVKSKNILNKFLGEYYSNLNNYGLDTVNVGVGSLATAVTDLYKSYQEAKVALELSKVFALGNTCYFDEMGFLKFIFTQPARELQEFSQRVLGRVMAYDLEIEADLLATLKAFIDNRCQVSECSKVLFVHENTLRTRLKKIEHLTGLDLRRVDHLVNVYIALQILNIGEDIDG